jgi:putative protease
MSHRDSNQGACTNTCRWKYASHEARETETGDVIPLAAARPDTMNAPPVMLLEEQNRPGELMPAYEDEHGTYIMNSKDLRAVQHVEKLTQMGIDSFKIEGRTKSVYYVARTTQVYRKAIDDAVAGQPFDMNLMDELEGMANRGFTEGFYRRHPPGEYQNYERGASIGDKQQFVGAIVDCSENWLTIEVKNHFEAGDRLQLMTTRGNISFDLATIIDRNGETTGIAPGSGHVVRIPVPESMDAAYIDNFSLLVRYLPRHEPS